MVDHTTVRTLLEPQHACIYYNLLRALSLLTQNIYNTRRTTEVLDHTAVGGEHVNHASGCAHDDFGAAF